MKKTSQSTFTCPSCKKEHRYSIYALAQLAQGHELIFTCTCGKKIYLNQGSAVLAP